MKINVDVMVPRNYDIYQIMEILKSVYEFF